MSGSFKEGVGDVVDHWSRPPLVGCGSLMAVIFTALLAKHPASTKRVVKGEGCIKTPDPSQASVVFS